MSQTKTSVISVPVGTDIESLVFHYTALFNAHGVRHTIPTMPHQQRPLHHGVEESQRRLLQDFKNVNLELYQFKNIYGDVAIEDMKVIGNTAHIIYSLGK